MYQIAKIFEEYETLIDKEVCVSGWVKTCRDQKEMIFIHLSDGTTQKTLQIIGKPENIDFDEIAGITTGTSLQVVGKLVTSPAKGQLFELNATKIKIYQICSQNFPFQKVGLTTEYMRNYPHLRHRSNLMRAVFAVKSRVMNSIHNYYTNNNFCYVDLPILTTNACEGGCQPLQVTSLIDSGKISDIPVTSINTNYNGLDVKVQTNNIDFSKDFFDNKVYLTVSNQLHLECFAHGLGFVYTITPTTRGEPSQSNKHLAYFNMLEAEFCFGELNDNILLAEGCIKYCINEVLTKCKEEITLLDMASNKTLIEKLKYIASEHEPFIRITHENAITLLKEQHETEKFIDIPDYSCDLTGEHERFLVKFFKKPVVVMHYPKNVKAFYMPVVSSKQIDGKIIEYVDCFDLLMDIGEVVGGSQRISNEKELVDRMMELDIDPKHLDWYVSLRRYGTIPHGGFGIGIERLVAVITGMTNIKDCISFPITVHHCQY
jgi:asparaginyl-tRNA synthetase